MSKYQSYATQNNNLHTLSAMIQTYEEQNSRNTLDFITTKFVNYTQKKQLASETQHCHTHYVTNDYAEITEQQLAW